MAVPFPQWNRACKSSASFSALAAGENNLFLLAAGSVNLGIFNVTVRNMYRPSLPCPSMHVLLYHCQQIYLYPGIINVLLTICPCSVSGPWISKCAGNWKGVAQWEYISLFSSIRAWIALLLAWILTMEETPRRRIMVTSSCPFIFIKNNRRAISSMG